MVQVTEAPFKSYILDSLLAALLTAIHEDTELFFVENARRREQLASASATLEAYDALVLT